MQFIPKTAESAWRMQIMPGPAYPLLEVAQMNVSFSQAAAALNATARWQESITENLASSSIPGFKKQELAFSAFEVGQMPTAGPHSSPYVLPAANEAINFRQGEHRFTGLSTDVALDGPGFFEIELPSGDSAFTRDGEFRFDSTGVMVTKEGFQVRGIGGPILKDLSSSGEVSISTDGVVSQGEVVIGNMMVAEFDNRQLLRPISRGKFLADDPGINQVAAEGTQFRQGFVEGSNTSPASEMAQMINSMRIYEANQRALQTHDERMGKAISTANNA